MVREETIEFVRENRELLRAVASRNESPVAPLAAALLLSVEPEEKGEVQDPKPPEKKFSVDTDADSAELDKILPKRRER